MSIDLQRFNTRLSNKFGGVRVRKEAFVDLEVYCLDPNGEPISKIHFADPPNAVAPAEEPKESAADQFHRFTEDFPALGDEYAGIYLKANNELERLKNLQNTGSLTSTEFKILRSLLEKMDDSLVSKFHIILFQL